MKPLYFIITVMAFALLMMSPWLSKTFFQTSIVDQVRNSSIKSVGYETRKEAQELLDLLASREFDKLQDRLEEAQEKGLNPYSGQSYLYTYIRDWTESKTHGTPESLIPLLDIWVNLYPESDIPYAFRGAAFESFAWDARGSKFASKTSKDQFKSMRQMFDKGYPDLMRAIHINPKNAIAYYSTVGYLFHASQFEKHHFNVVFKSGITQLPDYYWPYQRYIKTLAPKWRGRRHEAMAFARKTTKILPVGSPLKMLIVEAHRIEAEHLVREYKNNSKSILTALFSQKKYDPSVKKRGDYYNKPEVWKEITDIVNEVTEHNPELTYPLLSYAEIAFLAKQKETAMELYERAMKIDSYYGKTRHWARHALVRLGAYYKKLKQDEKALRFLETHIRLYPEEKNGYDYAAHIYSLSHQYDKSLPYYKKLVDMYPEHARYLSSYCSDLSSINKLDEAMTYCDRALEHDPDYAYGYHIRSYVRDKLGDEAGAKTDTEKYLKLNKNKDDKKK